MGSARILGCAVEVKAQELPHGDELYTVSGEGGKRLHSIAAQYQANPGELNGNTFTIKKSDVSDCFTFGDSPVHTALREGLAKSVRQEVSAGR